MDNPKLVFAENSRSSPNTYLHKHTHKSFPTKPYACLCVGVGMCVLSVICPTTVWAGTVGYTAGSALSHHHCTNPHTRTLAHIHPRTSESVFYLGTWVERPRQDSSQNPAHTHIHTSERRGMSLLTTPVLKTPKSSNISLSLSLSLCPLSVTAALRKRMKLLSSTHRCKQIDTVQHLYCTISTVHYITTEFS